MSSAAMPLQEVDHDPAAPLARPGVGALRLLIGLLQGVLLYLLYSAAQDKAWPATVPSLFVPMVLVVLLCPTVLVASVGHLAPARIARWLGGATVVIALLGAYDGWRRVLEAGARNAPEPPFLLVAHLIAALFIGHTLLSAASSEGRRIASYPAYFDAAWKLAVQLVFSAGFTMATWLVLNLGGELFRLIKLEFLHTLLGKAWFNIPAMVFAFTCAMHITDVRPAIVRGIRGLILVLMSWLLPVVSLMVGGFLISMIGTGLAPLWATRHAAAVLLAAAGLLVLMINAAWQNGDSFASMAAPVRWSARVAAVLLTPLVIITAWALALRVGDHGWTDDRIVAAATTFVAACYAGGYLAAAIGSSSLRRLAAVNIAIAFVIIAVILALFSPLLDPARVSVNSQLARLAAGKVSAEKFDYAYLRFHGQRYGQEALVELARRSGGADAAVIRAGATRALAMKLAYPALPTTPLAAPALAGNLTMWPQGASVPPGLLAFKPEGVTPWQLPLCLTTAGQRCDVFPFPGSSAGAEAERDVLVIGAQAQGGAVIMRDTGAAGWRIVATLPRQLAGCASLREQLIAGKLRAVAPAVPSLAIGDTVVTPDPVEPRRPLCADTVAPGRAAPASP